MGALGGDSFGNEANRARGDRASAADRRKRARAAAGKIAGTPRLGQVPIVKTLSLAQSPGAIEATWDSVGIDDLKRYEVQISTSVAFVSPTTFNVRDTQFLYEQGVAGTTYYFRVRAVNASEVEGPYSATGSASPGDIDTSELADNSVTEPKIASNAVTAAKIATGAVGSSEIASGAVDTDELAASAVSLFDDDFTASGSTTSAGDRDVLATVSITSVGTRLRLEFSLVYTSSGSTGDVFTFDVVKTAGTVTIWSETITTSTVTSGEKLCLSGVVWDTPGSGSVEYTLGQQRTSGSTDTMTATNSSLSVVELKR